MGISYSTARYLAPASFIYDFACQQYGFLSTPNMKQIHDSHLSFWSPQPYFIGGFFFPQQIIQVAWLYRLWKLNPKKSEAEKKEVSQIVDFVPYYAIGNFCIGTWLFFWNSANLKTSNVFVWINTLTQLFYCATQLGPMNTGSTSSVLTHVVAKTFAGIGVLDLLHNTSVAYFQDEAPSMLVKVLTGAIFGVGSFFSDWIFGGCLVYDLVALAIGQGGSWGMLLGAYAVGSAAIVAARNMINPPYVRKEMDYDVAAAAEEEDDETERV